MIKSTLEGIIYGYLCLNLRFAKVAIILFLKRASYIIFMLMLVYLPISEAYGQVIKPDSTLIAISADSLTTKQDTLKKDGALADPAFSIARDSIIEDFSGGKKMIYYYGDVSVRYENIELKADYMEYNLDTRTVYASGIKDTSGVLRGKPVLKEGSQSYTMESVFYNFESKKARITNMITQESEGFLHGTNIKKLADNSINISKGKYTTCDLDHPHFYLRMTKARMVTQPKRVTVFGPAYLILEDVPVPFALPFGFVPEKPERSGGLLIPSFQEEAARGFGLKGLGYYFVIGEHFDVSITGDIFSLGSWNAMLTARYRKRYKFNGDFGINYSSNITGERGSTDFFQSKDFSIRWSHSQDSKSMPGASFRASVNFSTPLNNRFNSEDVQTSLQNQASSSISYSKAFAGTPFSFSMNLMHSQNSLDSSYALTVPNFTFTMNRIYPFKRAERVGKERFYESLSLNYNTTFDNKVNFKAKDFGQPNFLSKFKSGMKHNFTIGLPTFTLLRYLNFSPGVSYGMTWFFQTNDRAYDPDLDRVVTTTSDMFSHFGLTQDFSASLSMNTRLYGLFNFGKKGALQAIRHMVTPSLSFSFRPEMGTPANGYRTLDYVDVNGIQHTLNYNRYDGLLYSPPGRGRSAAMSFSLGNNFEAKVRDQEDTTGTGLKKIKLIDNLSLGGSYNFLADSLKLSNINMNMNTTVFGALAFSANASFNPYAVDGRGRLINQFNIAKEGGFKLARLENASMTLSYQFTGKGERRGGVRQFPGVKGGGGDHDHEGHGELQGEGEISGVRPEQRDYTRVYYHPVTGEYIPGGWVYYLDPSIPWTVSMNYNYSYSRNYSFANDILKTNHNHMQTLGVSAQVRITKALNVNINTGFDLSHFALTTTQLSATYDLHCFQISVSWVPNGQWQSWSFRINAKASALADLLKFKKGSSYWDN
jgi:lipopolysaccharide assembly outer membrane protein LptD (OstA)